MLRTALITATSALVLAFLPGAAAAADETVPSSPWPTRLSVVSAVQQAGPAGKITVKVRTYAATRTLRGASAAAAEAVPGRYVTVTVTAFDRTGGRRVAGTCARATDGDGYLICRVAAPRRVKGRPATSFLAQVAYETGEVTSSLYDSRTVSAAR
ncbi:hypothetical protein DSM112329_05311 [Paraconexibacter sp. AEG42_29]|uniref:Uncharacterized protein n=1 Tax=Paraconexibacter sp. AEG42_29 TaxID=2997339 RepID=A0AAU7B329_9ACTN